MHDAITTLACPTYCYGGNPYWGYFALVLILLTWGVVVQRREKSRPRFLLRVFTGIGCFFSFIGISAALVLMPHGGDNELLLGVQGAAFAAGCIFLEIILSPPRERIPHAIALADNRGPSPVSARERDASSDPPARRS